MRVLSCFLQLLCCAHVIAFLPNPTNFESLARSPTEYHTSITRKAVSRVAATFFNDQTERPPGSKQIPIGDEVNPCTMFVDFYGGDDGKLGVVNYQSVVARIEQSNAGIDRDETTKADPEFHFDGERFQTSNQRVITLRSQIVRSISEENYEDARRLTGQALHILQDFYSHSNWVEMGERTPNAAIGILGENIGTVATAAQKTCKNCEDSDGACEANVQAEITEAKILTSGYYDGEKLGSGLPWPKPPAASMKCSHGGYNDRSRLDAATGGINKDVADDERFSPHASLHPLAASLAKNATVDFLNAIRREKAISNQQFGDFLGLWIGSTLAMVIDTTSSMGPYIGAAKRRAFSIIDHSLSSFLRPKDFVLVPFNDPDYGPVYYSKDPNEFKARINALSVYGGGDEPEMCFHGLQLAQLRSSTRAPLFVFTDASPKDPELADPCMDLAKTKHQSIYFVGVGIGNSAARVDNFGNEARIGVGDSRFDAYYRLAQQSGGQVIATSTSEEDIFKATAILDSLATSQTVSLLYLSEMTPATYTTTFGIDRSINTFTLMIHSPTAPLPTVEMISPSGKPSAYTLVSATPTQKVLQASPAEIGTWRLTIRRSGGSSWSVSIQGNSTFDCAVEYQTLYRETNHPGYQTILGSPIAASNLTLYVEPAKVCASYVLTSARFVDAKGETVSPTLALRGVDDVYFAEQTIPMKSYYIVIAGRDDVGNELQRFKPIEITPTRIELRAVMSDNGTNFIHPGGTLRIQLNITNLGADATFKIYATDTLHFVESVTPNSVSLRRSQSAKCDVLLRAPPTARVGSVSELEMIASVVGFGQETNFLQESIFVMPTEPDVYPPVCEVLSSTLRSACGDVWPSPSCTAKSWDARVRFSDRGSGIYKVVETASGGTALWQFTPANYSGLAGVWVSGSGRGNCCVLNVSLAIIDQYGLTSECVIARDVATTPRPTTTTRTTTTITTTTTPRTTTPKSTRRPTTTWSGRDGCVGFSCAGRRNGNYANPLHKCAKTFCSCSNGYVYTMDCPTDFLYFNEALDKCLRFDDVPDCAHP